MKESKEHQILAFFFDIFFIGSLCQIIAVLMITLEIPWIALSVYQAVGIFYIVFLIFYHSKFSKKAPFCTPGEAMAGCIGTPEGKKWFTIYKDSRFLLFITLFLLLLTPANAFDTIRRTLNYSFPLVIGNSIKVILMLFFIYKIAKGEFQWAAGIFTLFILQLITELLTQPFQIEIFFVSFGFMGIQMLFLTISLLIYKERESSE